ncbi:MAG: hypothetical protein B7X99_08645 [Rhizobiales bacterium 17-65-6]|nr:MAG: hypothetical protein B7X99_08645 [Rhizobiales bacterium 17-65-6]
MRRRFLALKTRGGDFRQVIALDQYAFFARLLDTIDIAFCLFDSQERLLIWNHSYIAFFPEHGDLLRTGQTYRQIAMRLYEATMAGSSTAERAIKVEESLHRFRAQTHPFTILHHGRRLQIATLTTHDGGRIRLWRDTARGDTGLPGAPGWVGFPIDLLDHMADGATVLGEDNRIIASNREFRRLYDVPDHSSVVGISLADIVRQAWTQAGESPPALGELDGLPGVGEPFEIELPGERWRRVMARRQSNGISYFSHADISLLKRQQKELLLAERRAREEEYRYRLLAENSSDVIVATSSDLAIQFVSPSVHRVLGWHPEGMVGRSLTAFIHDEGHAAFGLDSPGYPHGAPGPAIVTCRVRDAAGEWVWMEASIGRLPERAETPIALVCSFRDVTERVEAEQALKLAHDELASIAATDALTSLANRRRFDSVFEQEWRRAARDHHSLSLMLIDVEHFKAVNDGYGHVVGDECLRHVGRLIGGCIHRPADLAARYGGEEFVILLPQTPLSGALALADRIRTAMATADWKQIDPGLPALTVSVGICAVATIEGFAPTQALRMADEALYRAKNSGRDRCEARLLG